MPSSEDSFMGFLLKKSCLQLHVSPRCSYEPTGMGLWPVAPGEWRLSSIGSCTQHLVLGQESLGRPGGLSGPLHLSCGDTMETVLGPRLHSWSTALSILPFPSFTCPLHYRNAPKKQRWSHLKLPFFLSVSKEDTEMLLLLTTGSSSSFCKLLLFFSVLKHGASHLLVSFQAKQMNLITLHFNKSWTYGFLLLRDFFLREGVIEWWYQLSFSD